MKEFVILAFIGTLNVDTKATIFGYTGIDVKYGLLNYLIGKLIRRVYKYILIYLLIDFVNNFLSFFPRDGLYNICF